MPTTFYKSSYFGPNMLETPVLCQAKLGFLDSLRALPFGSAPLERYNYLCAPPSTAAVLADRSSHRFSLANSSFCGRMIS